MKTWRQVKQQLGMLEGFDVSTLALEDHAKLERAFPGCTAALDLNSRIREWAGHRFRAERTPCNKVVVPDEGWPCVLLAFRTNDQSGYVQTRTDKPVSMGARYFVEYAVFVPSECRWVVIR